jgi:hypothetical protein
MVRVSEKFFQEITILAKDGYDIIDASSARIINASNPIDGSDLATKDYVDGYGGGSGTAGTLEETLALGNSTGNNNIVLSGTGILNTANSVGTVKDFYITAGTSTDGGFGGDISLTAGDSTGNSTGSSIVIGGGSDEGAGSISIDAGIAGAGSGLSGGNIEFFGGNGDGFLAGGSISFFAGDGGSGGIGGDFNITAGSGSSATTHGRVNINTDSGDIEILSIWTNSVGSNIQFTETAESPRITHSIATLANGKDMYIEAQHSSFSDGGDLNLSAGNSTVSDNGGDVIISSGLSNVPENSGDVTIQVGDSSAIRFNHNTTLNLGQQNYVATLDSSTGQFLDYISPSSLVFNNGITISGNGYILGDGYVSGKLTVLGLIDPTGLVLDTQSSVPGGIPDSGKATLWIRNSDGYVIITDENGIDNTLNSGGSSGTTQSLGDVLIIGNDGDGAQIKNIADPTDPQDVATKSYIDGYTFPSSSTQTLSEVLTEGNSAGNLRIIDVLDPTNPQDVATKAYIDGYTFPSSSTQTLLEVLTEGNSAGNIRITDVLDPVNDQDVATRVWVEDQISNIDVSSSVGNINFCNLLSGIATNDSIAWKVVGMAEIDSDDFLGSATFETILFTSNTSADGYARLYNATTQSVIGNYLETNSDEPVLLSESIVLDNGSNLYEIQIKIDSETSSDFISCGMGRIRVDGYNTNNIIILPILSGIETNNTYAWVEIGMVEIDPADYNYNTSTFQVLLSSTDGYTTDGNLVAEARLYNITDQSMVSNILSSESNIAELVSEVISLDVGSNLYSVQLRLSEDGGITNFATCSMARIILE